MPAFELIYDLGCLCHFSMRGEVAGLEQAIRGSSESRYDNERFSTCSFGNNGTGTINSGGILD